MALVVRYMLPGDDTETTVVVYRDDSNLERGRYYDIDITVNFGVTGDSFLKVARDGKEIVNYDGPIGYGYGVYWKHGIYRAESGEMQACRLGALGQRGRGTDANAKNAIFG